MIPSGGIQAALAGLHGSLADFARASEKVTRTLEPGELATNIVEMKTAAYEVKLQTAVIRTEDEVLDSLLDLFA